MPDRYEHLNQLAVQRDGVQLAGRLITVKNLRVP
jgi:hypothetical protein